jgi:phosphatidylserine/phosphatidylglycerophosphate/cardiolipin synthase-like enzyme
MFLFDFFPKLIQKVFASGGRVGSYRYSLISFLIISLFFSTLAKANSYPWIWMGKNDIQVTDHPRVEAEFRLNLVRNAKVSIDILTFDQRADDLVGKPLLVAIEEAAQRGVKIRFGTAWLAPILKDPLFRASRFLSYVAKQNPNLQYLEVGGCGMRKRGWGYIDGIH